MMTGRIPLDALLDEWLAGCSRGNRMVRALALGRDRTREAAPAKLIDWLMANYRLSATQGYVPQDETYRQVKEWLLHRPPYEFKLLLQLFERPMPSHKGTAP